MRRRLLALVLAAAATACGGGGGGADGEAAPPAPAGSPTALGPFEPWTPPAAPVRDAGMSLAQAHGGSGDEAAIIFAQPNFPTGETRVAFAVAAMPSNELLTAPQADVYLARSPGGDALGPYRARLTPIQAEGAHHHDDVGHFDPEGVYVVRLPLREPGVWHLVAVLAGDGRRVAAEGALQAVESRPEPGPGDRAPASRTPTLASTGGDVEALTTADPPDLPLLRTSVADALAAGRPFAVMFSTPAFCTSRLCGPATEVMLALERRYRGRGMDFIHVEIYRDNEPPEPNRWVKEWRLETEPFTFVVGADGRVSSVLEGPQTPNELVAMIDAELEGAPAAG
jgi:hypothetical protein